MHLGLSRVESDISDLFDSLEVHEASKQQVNSIKLLNDSFVWRDYQFTSSATSDIVQLLQFNKSSFDLLSLKTKKYILNDLLKSHLETSSLLFITQGSVLVAVRPAMFNPVPATIFLDGVRKYIGDSDRSIVVDFSTYSCGLNSVCVGVYFTGKNSVAGLSPGFYFDLNPFSDQAANFGPFIFSEVQGKGLRFASSWFTYSMLRDDRNRLAVTEKLVHTSVTWAEDFLNRLSSLDIMPKYSRLAFDSVVKKPRLRSLFDGLWGRGPDFMNSFLNASKSYRSNAYLEDSYELAEIFKSVVEGLP